MKNNIRKIVSGLVLLCIIAYAMLIFPQEIFATSDTDVIVINMDLLYDDNYLYNECIKGIDTIVPNTVYEKSVIYTSSSGIMYQDEIQFEVVLNTVLTPNGSDAAGTVENNFNHELYTVRYLQDIPDSVKQNSISDNKRDYDLYPISEPTNRYNCHSYAWYNQSTSQNDIWMRYPYVYFSDYDRSYVQVSNPRIGDIVCYYTSAGVNAHSGIITGYTDQSSNGTIGDLNKYIVTSKWGAEGLYEHRGDICPYMYATEVRYYRPRTNGSLNLSDDMSMASASATLMCDGSITDKYAMYELSVTDRMDYLISVQSTSCNVKFYDLHMNYFNVSSYQYTTTTDTYLYTLPYGVTYLRIQNLSTTDDSDITITVVPHDGHSYVYKPLNASSHIEQCKCGAVGETESHEWVAGSSSDYLQCRWCNHSKYIGGKFVPIIRSINAEIQPTFAYEDMAS